LSTTGMGPLCLPPSPFFPRSCFCSPPFFHTYWKDVCAPPRSRLELECSQPGRPLLQPAGTLPLPRFLSSSAFPVEVVKRCFLAPRVGRGSPVIFLGSSFFIFLTSVSLFCLTRLLVSATAMALFVGRQTLRAIRSYWAQLLFLPSKTFRY